MLKKILFISVMLSSVFIHADQRDMFKEEKAENLKYTKTIRAFMSQSKKMTQLVHKSYAHAVFPRIWKGGLILGYASGEGRVFFRGGVWKADASITQYTIGAQAGASTYSEIIFFLNKEALIRFIEGGFEDSTQTSIVPLYSGLSYDTNFDEGVKVYTMSEAGLMLELSSGIQSFEYEQKK